MAHVINNLPQLFRTSSTRWYQEGVKGSCAIRACCIGTHRWCFEEVRGGNDLQLFQAGIPRMLKGVANLASYHHPSLPSLALVSKFKSHFFFKSHHYAFNLQAFQFLCRNKWGKKKTLKSSGGHDGLWSFPSRRWVGKGFPRTDSNECAFCVQQYCWGTYTPVT